MKSKSKDFSIIDRQLDVDGTLATKGKLIIKGSVRGTLNGETVIIAREGRVCASVRVASMTIGGSFEGDIEATEELVILSTGNCAGKVVCRDFVVEAGGILNAEVTCTAGTRTDKALPAPQKG